MKRRLVLVFVAVVAGGVALWDVFLAVDEIDDNTISEVLRDVSKEHPIVAFALGILIGHWYW